MKDGGKREEEEEKGRRGEGEIVIKVGEVKEQEKK